MADTKGRKETEAQKTRRLGPIVQIVRFRWKNAKRRVRWAYDRWGHRRSADATPRRAMRCRECLAEGRTKDTKWLKAQKRAA